MVESTTTRAAVGLTPGARSSVKPWAGASIAGEGTTVVTGGNVGGTVSVTVVVVSNVVTNVVSGGCVVVG